MSDKYEINDLIATAYQQKPADFETVFNDLIIDRLRAAVEAKKIDVAQKIYGYEEPETSDEEDTTEEE